MTINTDMLDGTVEQDEAYFDVVSDVGRGFDARLLQEPLTLLPSRSPLVFDESACVKDAMQAISSSVDRSIEAIGRGMDGSMSLAERELHEYWLEAARGDLERLDRALELGEQETARRREALAEAAKGRLILEQLHDQELESYRRALELQERKMFDEVALREYSMRRREENVSS